MKTAELIEKVNKEYTKSYCITLYKLEKKIYSYLIESNFILMYRK